MSEAGDIRVEQDEGGIILSGSLDVDTSTRALDYSRDWFEQGRPLSIDLSGVSRSDSAGVALLLEWQRRAERANVDIRYLNLPRQMQALVRFCHLDDVLALG